MKKNGFTLIELLVSISIIAILTVLASLSFSKAQKNGRDQRRINDLKSVQSAAEQYHLLNNEYPTSINVGWTGPDNQMILAKFPVDPKNTGSYIYTVNTLSSSNYCICALMEDSKNANSAIDCSDFVNITNYFCVKNQQ